MAVEKAALADPDVQADIAKLDLPKGAVVVVDPWIYGMWKACKLQGCLGDKGNPANDHRFGRCEGGEVL